MEIIILIVTVILSGVAFEKLLSPTLNIEECARKLKTDVMKVVKGLFAPSRHQCNDLLTGSFLKILSGYYHEEFTPSIEYLFLDKTPLIRITFVPNRKYSTEEILILCKLLSHKFRLYLRDNMLNWKFFVEHQYTDETIIINLFYKEFNDDYVPFMKQYRNAVREKATPDFGVLHDDSLDKELQNVK